MSFWLMLLIVFPGRFQRLEKGFESTPWWWVLGEQVAGKVSKRCQEKSLSSVPTEKADTAKEQPSLPD